MLLVRIGLVALATLIAAPGQAQTVEEFYKKNNTIEIVVGFAPGTGYDAWFRPIGRFMTKHLPGNPTFVLKNMPGGGSLIAANYLFNQAPKNGTSLGSFSRNLPSQAMMGLNNVKFDPRKFSWIGSPEMTLRICAVMTRTGMNTVEDLRKREIVMGGTGVGSLPGFLPALLNQIIGTKFKTIDSYDSGNAVYLAMARGEVDGMCQTSESLLRGAADLFQSKQLKVLFNLERQRSASLGNVPSVYEYVTKDEDRQLLDYIGSSTELGRPLAGTPDIPADRLSALRAAFMATMSDPEFIAEAQKLKLEIDVRTGEQIAERIDALYKTPKGVIERANTLMGGPPK